MRKLHVSPSREFGVWGRWGSLFVRVVWRRLPLKPPSHFAEVPAERHVAGEGSGLLCVVFVFSRIFAERVNLLSYCSDVKAGVRVSR